jgi:hypothetical protein
MGTVKRKRVGGVIYALTTAILNMDRKVDGNGLFFQILTRKEFRPWRQENRLEENL